MTIRKLAVLEFLQLSSSNMRSREVWEKILAENVVFFMPITPFRYFHKKEIKDGKRRIAGIDGIISDCASVQLLVEGIGQGTVEWVDNAIR
jgi:hypothetical protein